METVIITDDGHWMEIFLWLTKYSLVASHTYIYIHSNESLHACFAEFAIASCKLP